MPTYFLHLRYWYAAFACVLTLSACAPTYNWREVHGTSTPFTVLMPAKPTTESRAINLSELPVTMTMNVAEVNGAMFAVGTAETPNSTQAATAIKAMKNALINNIHGTIKSEKSSAPLSANLTTIDIEATGAAVRTGGEQRRLFARFVAREKWVYQVIVTGNDSAVTQDAVDTFFSSFKPN